jgi:hypothetical protein
MRDTTIPVHGRASACARGCVQASSARPCANICDVKAQAMTAASRSRGRATPAPLSASGIFRAYNHALPETRAAVCQSACPSERAEKCAATCLLVEPASTASAASVYARHNRAHDQAHGVVTGGRR